MKYLLSVILVCLFSMSTFEASAQKADFDALLKEAYMLMASKDFEGSGKAYVKAFAINKEVNVFHRYNAACVWSLANQIDSAFTQLFIVLAPGNYSDLDHFTSDSDLVNCHEDPRWKDAVAGVKANKDKIEENYDWPLVKQLEAINDEDQKYRRAIGDIRDKFGYKSDEMKAHWKVINTADSINLIAVKKIIDEHGWLGKDIVGKKGNSTLFLVIQHSDQETQEYYLPMMRQAVKDGKARGASLALLEDRVTLGKGELQIYGSQIGTLPDSEVHYVLPLIDPENVNERREEVGLPSIEDYVGRWDITWDAEAYKVNLPGYLEIQKARMAKK